MVALAVSGLALLAGTAYARECRNLTVPVTISARNGVFDKIPTPTDNIGATQFIQNMTRQGGNFTAQALTGYATVNGTYNITGTYCKPSARAGSYGSRNSTLNLQILTHGIGFDRSYWDIPYNNYNYSYVNTAVDQYGYATFAYDRLGLGQSSHGEPKNEIQAFLEVSALAQLTNELRRGSLPGVNDTFSKIVHVGHSFGSIQSFALTAMYPNISDGIVLTGFSANSSFVPYFAAGGDFQQAYLNQPLRFGNKSAGVAVKNFLDTYSLTDLVQPLDPTTASALAYPPGYLVPSNAGANQYQFFYPPYFDSGILYFSEQSKQPVTIGELLTVAAAPMSNTFKGPVLVITGQYDLPFCGGDCFATGGAAPSIPAEVKMGVPNATNFQAYIQPNTGHGINAHYNSTGAYRVINDYLRANGIGSS